MCRLGTRKVGQNRIYTPYMTVYMVISLPKIPYTHRMYMVLANPRYAASSIWMRLFLYSQTNTPMQPCAEPSI